MGPGVWAPSALSARISRDPLRRMPSLAVRTFVRPSCASDSRHRALRCSSLLFVSACLRGSFSRACQELTRLLVPLSAPSGREMVLSLLAAPFSFVWCVGSAVVVSYVSSCACVRPIAMMCFCRCCHRNLRRRHCLLKRQGQDRRNDLDTLGLFSLGSSTNIGDKYGERRGEDSRGRGKQV